MHFLVLLSALLACAAGVPSNTANPTQDGRIAGGYPTRIEHHPHQVAVLPVRSQSFVCGGSIISPTCVVTAAQCVAGTSSNNLSVRAGSTRYSSGGTLHRVTHGFYHGSYNPRNHDYDVAVLRIEPPFRYSDSVQPIILGDFEISPGTNVFVTGWGSTWSGGPINSDLNEAIVQITDARTCNASHHWTITDRMVCTATCCGGIGPCDRDRGGPLFTPYCPPTLVGIVSRDRHCGDRSYPAVYTKVSAVRVWIEHLCSVHIIPNGIIKADAMP